MSEVLARDPSLALAHLGRTLETAPHGFAALNTALFEDGAVVFVGEGAALERPLHLLFYGAAGAVAAACLPRNLIVLERGASATVVEHYLGEEGAAYLTDAVTEIELGDGAVLRHVKLQEEPGEALHLERIEVRQGRDSRFESHAVALGARISRTEIATRLGGEGAECSLRGLYLVERGRHADHHTTIDHAASRTRSRELYKGVCFPGGKGVFTGRVIVREGTAGVDAEQTNKNLLLGPDAVAETRPQLEIYADDVRCSHGATVGQLEEEALFYARQRGLDRERAEALLTFGFCSEVVASLPIGEAAAERIERRIVDRLEGGTN